MIKLFPLKTILKLLSVLLKFSGGRVLSILLLPSIESSIVVSQNTISVPHTFQGLLICQLLSHKIHLMCSLDCLLIGMDCTLSLNFFISKLPSSKYATQIGSCSLSNFLNLGISERILLVNFKPLHFQFFHPCIPLCLCNSSLGLQFDCGLLVLGRKHI